ncbi:Maf family protein [Methylicorpusculum sp.]|uniref:Maf family protein n=1 Tax=Methylicorpusculum sp. TaxID=2713644 RepID=UPI00272F9F44|nr:Maf family protein [Methylicorpusculum sp.]MDP2180433.1 Maf family protein [Methylicorpusculum sp.]MDP3530833.1 Maf family protein [Methylicorpusculum sp.]MDZ4151351.1 Maf family protein [Methylicorpusculum sp.]
MTAQIILASASPRRRELLDQIGVRYEVCPVDIDETPKMAEPPLVYVQRVAAEKSAACAVITGVSKPVLAADTAVILNGNILGKPLGRDQGLSMLRQLSGTTHHVFSAISLRGRHHEEAVSITEVTFRQLSEAEIAAYWETGEPDDKAGAYAIQGLGSIFVKTINGSFSGVMGLPLYETAELLAKQGIEILR